MRLTRRMVLVSAVFVVAAGFLIRGVGTGGGEHDSSSVSGVVTSPPSAPETRSSTAAVRSLSPVKVGKTAELTGGVTVTVGKVTPVTASALGPGEIGGSAVSVEVRVSNSRSGPFELGTLAVNATYDGGTPAIPNDSDPAKPLSGVLQPGRTAAGVYVFTLPQEKIAALRVDISSGLARDVVVFRG